MYKKDNYEILAGIKRLSEVNEQRDIKPLMSISFPGTHCPLMGVLMTIRQIPDVYTIVIGTDECTYYSKLLTQMPFFNTLRERDFSVVIDDFDVTFGTINKTRKAVAELLSETKPKCILLVTTCVLEIINDDYDSLVNELEQDYNIPILLVHTEHFKCQDHIPGIERTLCAIIKLINNEQKENIFNVLGNDAGVFKNSKVEKILLKSNLRKGLQIPGKCSVDDIKKASRAKLNVVIDSTGLTLGKMMKDKFNVPYIYFPPLSNPRNIMKSYEELSKLLKIDIPQDVFKDLKECLLLEEKVKTKLKNVEYIYGNSKYMCWEFNAYLSSLGLKPLLIEANEVNNLKGSKEKEELLKNVDPYICKGANLEAMDFVFDKLKPRFFIGRNFSDRIRKKGIVSIDDMKSQGILGFDGCIFLLSKLLQLSEEK